MCHDDYAPLGAIVLSPSYISQSSVPPNERTTPLDVVRWRVQPPQRPPPVAQLARKVRYQHDVPRRVGTLDVPKSFCKGFCPGYFVGRILWSVRICRGSRSASPELVKHRTSCILKVPHSANSPKEVCCAVAVAQLAECATQVETLIYYHGCRILAQPGIFCSLSCSISDHADRRWGS